MALDVFIAYGVDGLSKDDERQTKSYKNETLSGEEYYEAGLKGKLMDPESKREPLLLSDLKLVREKPSGTAEGGVYKDVNGGIWIVKVAHSPVHEYLGSKVMDLLIGPLSPEVRLLADTPGYTASKLLPGFLTKSEVMNNPNHNRKPIVGEEKLEIAMDLMGLGDRHEGNVGYIDMGDRLEAARVDFDASFRFLDSIRFDDSKAMESIIGIPDEMILYVLGDAYNDLWEFGTSFTPNYEEYKDLGARLIERKHALKDHLPKAIEYEAFYDKAKNDPLSYTREDYEQFRQLISEVRGIPFSSLRDKNPMLTWSVETGEPNIVRLFLKNSDVDVSSINKSLVLAVKNNYMDVTRLLLDSGANVNFKDKFGLFALFIAVSKGNLDMVRLLLDKGADVNLNDGMALYLAKEKGFTEIINLLEAKANEGWWW